jgi:hypothetical protein
MIAAGTDVNCAPAFFKTSPDCKDARGIVQESLVRLLLSVECLQPRISEILLEKVGEFALTGDE